MDCYHSIVKLWHQWLVVLLKNNCYHSITWHLVSYHWKPIEYISTWTKTIDQFHHAKNWPSLWSSGHGTPHKALTIDRFHCARNWPSLWSMVSSNAQFILAQRCGFTREGAVVKNYAFGHSLQICEHGSDLWYFCSVSAIHIANVYCVGYDWPQTLNLLWKAGSLLKSHL